MEAFWDAENTDTGFMPSKNNLSNNTMGQKQFDNTNRGVLFNNDRKETEKHPDFSGSINIAGVEYFLSAWKKQSKAGTTFLSLSIGNKKNVQPSQQVQEVKQHVQSVQAEQDAISIDDLGF